MGKSRAENLGANAGTSHRLNTRLDTKVDADPLGKSERLDRLKDTLVIDRVNVVGHTRILSQPLARCQFRPFYGVAILLRGILALGMVIKRCWGDWDLGLGGRLVWQAPGVRSVDRPNHPGLNMGISRR